MAKLHLSGYSSIRRYFIETALSHIYIYTYMQAVDAIDVMLCHIKLQPFSPNYG